MKGKSTVLKKLISLLPKSSTFVTAPTGLAAININGLTLYQFAGIQLGDGTIKELTERVLSNDRSCYWWKSAKVLIIDEISMVSKELFEQLDLIAKVVRKNRKPFGGIQLVLSGDFHQLPPVTKNNQQVFFCFESPVWSEKISKTIVLERVYRQSQANFVDMLHEIRSGICSERSREILASREKNVTESSEWMENSLQVLIKLTSRLQTVSDFQLIPRELVFPTILHTHNANVDSVNENMLKQIKRKGRIYEAVDIQNEKFANQISRSCPAPQTLKLKPGAQVVLLKNLDTRGGLCNGSRGIIVGFDKTRNDYPHVLFRSGRSCTVEPTSWTTEVAGKIVASRTQIPLKLAWFFSFLFF